MTVSTSVRKQERGIFGVGEIWGRTKYYWGKSLFVVAITSTLLFLVLSNIDGVYYSGIWGYVLIVPDFCINLLCLVCPGAPSYSTIFIFLFDMID